LSGIIAHFSFRERRIAWRPERLALGDVDVGVGGAAGAGELELHGRYHVHQTRCVAAYGQYLGDQIFLADVRLVDMLDVHAGSFADLLRALVDSIAQGLGKARAIEDADAARVQKAGYAPGAAGSGRRAGDDDAVATRQHAVQVRRAALCQSRCCPARLLLSARRHRMTSLVPALPGWVEPKRPLARTQRAPTATISVAY
jgi:hypothetical protein